MSHRSPFRRLRRADRWRRILPMVLALVFAAPAGAEPFAPRCWDAAPGFNDVKDFDFDPENMLATWQNDPVLTPDGTLVHPGWITIAPYDGDGNIVVDQRLECVECSPAPMGVTVAAGEFVTVGGTTSLYFTSMSEDETTVRIGKLTRHAPEDWRLSFLPESDGRVLLMPGVDPADVAPRVYYRTMAGTFSAPDAVQLPLSQRFVRTGWGWRWDDDSPAPIDVAMDPAPFLPQNVIGGEFTGRFLPDGSKLVHRAAIWKTWIDLLLNRPRLIPAIYDFETNRSRLLLADRRDLTELAEYTWPVTFSAPELGGDAAVVGIVKNRPETVNHVVVWRQQEDGGWIEWSRIPPVDPDYPCYFHPEGFSVNGRSYVVVEAYRLRMCQTDLVFPTPSIIVVASVDPATPDAERVRRVVSVEPDAGRTSMKTDAEAVTIAGNEGEHARIYYRDYGSPFGWLSGGPSTFAVCDPDL